MQHALHTLEKSAISIMEEFQPQEIANIMHIVAKKQYKTCLWSDLERRAEAVAGKFNSQNVANMLWAFATMGTKPGERMMGQLERRAEAISGEFNWQAVVNTPWGACDDGDNRVKQPLFGGLSILLRVSSK